MTDEALAYAWYLRHRPSHTFLQVSLTKDGGELSVMEFDSIKDATPFDQRSHALDLLCWLMEDRPDYEILDYAVRPEPIPDADQTPVRSLADVMTEARAKRQALVAKQFNQGGFSTLTDTPPVGEQQRQAEERAPKGYGQGGFAGPANSPLFPPRRASPQ